MRDPDMIALEIIKNLPGDEYWIDTKAAAKEIADAIRYEREIAIRALQLVGCYTRDVALAILDNADDVEQTTGRSK